jgi:protein-L-isoaspartate(D-aspartate) O-methyltransferase
MTSPDYTAARQEMIRRQLQRRGIHDERVLAAMDKVPRERFVPEESRHLAYADRALAIHCNQTISQPYIVALMTQALELRGDEKVLEVGTGSGYQTAILAESARDVISVERHAELSQAAEQLLKDLDYQNTTLIHGDGTLGWEEGAPYDRIIVTAASLSTPPHLFQQLAEGGILVIPLGSSDYQVLQSIQKRAGEPIPKSLCPCRFVPLVGEEGWPE